MPVPRIAVQIVWPVYILPEEVDMRVNAIGVNVIALHSRRSDSHPGQLDIISPTDPAPGLVWMFAGLIDVAALRETPVQGVMASFLFKG